MKSRTPPATTKAAAKKTTAKKTTARKAAGPKPHKKNPEKLVGRFSLDFAAMRGDMLQRAKLAPDWSSAAQRV